MFVIFLFDVLFLNVLFFLSGLCWPCVRVVKTQLGPSRPVSTAGSRCAVCGLMFSPTSPAEGVPDMFISAGEAAVPNCSCYLFGCINTALAALCSLTCGPMCARPYASWLRTTRLLLAQTYNETGWGRLHLGGQLFFYFFQCEGAHCLGNRPCTALISVLYCMCKHSLLHVHFLIFFVFLFFLFCNLFFQCRGVHCLVNIPVLH